eukprot:evm.model.scf_1736.3 EVM.evm.TU.scf_1736.3   scf_1736:22258-23330(+)
MGDLKLAEALLAARANASQQEPSTGASPLVVAIAKGDRAMVRLLLAYGARPDLPDGNGVTAYNAIKVKPSLKDILEEYDR